LIGCKTFGYGLIVGTVASSSSAIRRPYPLTSALKIAPSLRFALSSVTDHLSFDKKASERYKAIRRRLRFHQLQETFS
jgi:hypothetical protein